MTGSQATSVKAQDGVVEASQRRLEAFNRRGDAPENSK